MENFPNPFADPQVVSLMKQVGAVHTPGMASRLVNDLRPLLLEDGYDLDNLGETSLEELDEAFGRAVEKYNATPSQDLFADRDAALEVLDDFTLYVEEGDERRARALIRALTGGNSADLPPASLVLEVAVKTLYFQFNSPEDAAELKGLRLPKWPKKPRGIGVELIRQARGGRAIEALPALIEKHGEGPVLEGTLLACAAALLHLEASGAGEAQFFEGGTAQEKRVEAEVLKRDFSAWALTHVPVDRADELEPVVAMAERILDPSAPVPSPLLDPEVLARFIDMVFDQFDSDPDQFTLILESIQMYLFFRVETGQDLSAWIPVYDHLESTMDALSNPFEAVVAQLREKGTFTELDQRSAQADTRIGKAVGSLLDWIGEGRKVTETGTVRRADIQDFASLLGLQVIGVAKKLPSGEADPSVTYVRSMSEEPALNAWWEALQSAGLIQVGITKVHAGPLVDEWEKEELPPLLASQIYTSVYLEVLLSEQPREAFSDDSLMLVSSYLVENLENPNPQPLSEHPLEDTVLSPLVVQREARNMLKELVDFGFLTSSHGVFSIRPGLQIPVLIGLQLAMQA